MFTTRHVLGAHDVHELIQLVGDLLYHRFRARGNKRKPGYRRIVRRGYREGLNIVAASGKETRDASKSTGFVLQEYGDDVTHGNWGLQWIASQNKGFYSCAARRVQGGSLRDPRRAAARRRA